MQVMRSFHNILSYFKVTIAPLPYKCRFGSNVGILLKQNY